VHTAAKHVCRSFGSDAAASHPLTPRAMHGERTRVRSSRPSAVLVPGAPSAVIDLNPRRRPPLARAVSHKRPRLRTRHHRTSPATVFHDTVPAAAMSFEGATRCVAEGQELARAIGWRLGEAFALTAFALVRAPQGHFEQALGGLQGRPGVGHIAYASLLAQKH
jgi:hypothetical protein